VQLGRRGVVETDVPQSGAKVPSSVGDECCGKSTSRDI